MVLVCILPCICGLISQGDSYAGNEEVQSGNPLVNDVEDVQFYRRPRKMHDTNLNVTPQNVGGQGRESGVQSVPMRVAPLPLRCRILP